MGKSKLKITAVVTAMLLLAGLSFGAGRGDVDSNGKVEMKDAVMGLQSAADIRDIPGAGLSDSVAALQALAGISVMHCRAVLGPLAGSTVKVFNITDLETPVYTTQTDSGGYFTLTLSGTNPGVPLLVKITGGADTDANDDGETDYSPTPLTGSVYALVFPGETGEFNVSAISDIAWRYTENLIGDVDVEAVKMRLDDLAKKLIAEDIDGDGTIDSGDIYAFSPLNAEHRGKLNFDFQLLFTDDGNGNTIINTYHNNRPEILAALLEALFGSRLTLFPQSDNRYDKVEIDLTVFGKGSVSSNTGGIDVDTGLEDQSGNVYSAFYDQDASAQVILTAAPKTDTEIISWVGCDSVSADKTQCVVNQKTDHAPTVTFGYKETQLKSGVRLVDLSSAHVGVHEDQMILDVTAGDGDTEMQNILASIQEGDIVVGGADGGFLRKVAIIEKINDTHYVFGTFDASLEEVVAQGSGALYKQMTNGDLAPSGGGARSKRGPGVTTAENVRFIPSDDPNDKVFRLEIGDPRKRASMEGSLKWPADNPVVTISGSIEVLIDLDSGVSFSVWPPGLEYFKFIPKVTATESLNITATAEVSTPDGDDAPKIELATLTFAPISFAIGPVPVWVEPAVKIYLGVEAKAGGEITAGITFKQVARAGIVYNRNAGVDLVTEFTPSFEFTPPTGAVYAEVKPYVETGPALYIYSVTGPQVTVKAYLKLRGEAELPFTDEPCFDGIEFAAYRGLEANWAWDLKKAEKLGKWAESLEFGGTLWSAEELIKKWNMAGTCGTLPPYMAVEGFDMSETITAGSTALIQKQYTIKNTGDLAMDWEAVWLEDSVAVVSPVSGNIGGGQSAMVTVTVDPASLSIGEYSNEIEFNNLYDGGTLSSDETGSTVRGVNISITPPPLAAPVLAQPQIATDGNGDPIASKVVLNWTYPDSNTLAYVDGYTVWKTTNPAVDDQWMQVAANVTGSTYTVANLSANTTYYFAVDAYGTDVDTGYSETVSITTPSVPITGDFTNSLGMAFKLIPAGTFMMGSPTDELGRDSDETQHQVTLSQDFYIMTTEVTNQQYVDFLNQIGQRGTSEEPWFDTQAEDSDSHIIGDTGNFTVESGFENHPVIEVSWYGARAMYQWLSAQEGGNYRLPTEAEWEYAARAGTSTAFYNGGITETSCGIDPNLDQIGWYCGNANSTTHVVAQKLPNDWGLYDMSGNVWEWCQDWYGTYPSSAVTDPEGPSTGSYRVLRGGSWDHDAQYCRSADRDYYGPSSRSYNIGFRLAFSPGR